MLHLIRGLPGSGKSTFAKNNFSCLHVEADMFFQINGEYCWSGNYIKGAHRWCQDTTHLAVVRGLDVVVANTFTTLKEMQPYLDMTDEIKVYRMQGEWGSIHSVPEETIRKMAKRFEDYTGEILV